MDPPPPPSSNGVSVPKYSSSSTFMNIFAWYLFQTLTVSSMLLMVLSISWTLFSANNIQVVCVICSVAFAIISPTFIVPNLPQIAAVAFPIIDLYQNVFYRVLNIFVWMGFGVLLYPLPANLLCYSLMVCVGLVKVYSDGGESDLLRLMTVIGIDALGVSYYVFDYEKKHGTGRWVKSSTGWSLLGLFAVVMLAHYLPPLVKPEKKKKMNEIEAIFTKVASEKEMVNVAEAPIPGSGTKTILEIV